MKILGCFKVVPDLDLVAEEDWELKGQLHVDTSYVKPIWNCFDESALEMMLKLSDLSGSFNVIFELSALTVGKEKDETFLKTLYALGYTHAVRIMQEEPENFDPERLAGAIAGYLKKYAMQDVVVMGGQSSVGSNMKTPYLLAELLGWPCFTQVTAMEPVDETCLKITCKTDGGSLIRTVKTPCVLVVGNAENSYLRVPTLKDKMKLGKKPIERLTLEEVYEESPAEPAILVSMENIERKRDTKWIEGATPQEKAEKLFESYLKERLGKL